MTILAAQRRHRSLGRVRIGAKDDRGYPTRTDTFRLTSPNLELLRQAAERWGGEPGVWPGAPTGGTQYELQTDAEELQVYVPPQDIDGSQWFELWSGGGLVRRCDGVTESESERPCLCDPNRRECQPTTHLEVMLPQLADVGVWRLTTHGWNAAAEIPATVELIHKLSEQAGVIPSAVLAIEQRTSKTQGQTRHYAVPVLRLPYALASLGDSLGLSDSATPAGRGQQGDRPALPEESGGGGVLSAPGFPPDASPPVQQSDEGSTRMAPGQPDGAGSVFHGGGTDPAPDRAQLWDQLVEHAGSRARARAWLNEATGQTYNAATVLEATDEELRKTLARFPA